VLPPPLSELEPELSVSNAPADELPSTALPFFFAALFSIID
jgi:hypothetical protein